MEYPTLYKLTVNNKIQEWSIMVLGNTIITTQGQISGKKQIYDEIIKKGKNIGKVNETTPAEQAHAEAKSKWEHKHNKDYHLTIEECKQKGKIANRGGYLPMLAQSYQKHAKKHLVFPCYVQPKLDGLRCIATKTEEGVKLWFRSGKKITTMQHIVNELNKVMNINDIYDGELYIHEKDFNEFTGAIRANKNLNPELTNKVQYHIYDFPRIEEYTEQSPFIARFTLGESLIKYYTFKHIKTVDSYIVRDFADFYKWYKYFINQGYEGIMLRNKLMPYEQKRSYNLLKYKEFIDDEFIIIGVKEGKGSLVGHVGSFICKIEANRILKDINDSEYKFGNQEGIVKAKMDGKREHLKYLFENPKEYMGKPLTIKYQNLSKDGIPRFPVGKSIRFDK